ncbi:reverse transcriptase domain-containing protein [Tanacetum coccineum]
MSQPANPAQTPTNSAVQNTTGKGSKQTPDNNPGYLPTDKLREICEKHYNQILPIMVEKVHQEKLQGVQTRLTYGESSYRNSQTQFSKSESCGRKKKPKRRQSPVTALRRTRSSQTASVFSRLRHERDKLTRRRSPMSATLFTGLGHKDKDVFTQFGERKRSVNSRLGLDAAPRHKHVSRKRSATRSAKNLSRKRKDARELIRSYVTCSSERQQEIEEEWDAADRESRRSHTRTEERYHSENDCDRGGHWKSKKCKPNYEDYLSQPWLCEETGPFTARIQNFEVPKRTCMRVNVKTYDGTGNPNEHLKIFQVAKKIERWAMPTWCHMFNSTLISSARVWFDKLPPESIDNYEMLRKTFLGNYSQQKKYIKYPVEIHHIKQREGEPTEAFMERFKAESMYVSGALECMRISG